MLPLRRARAARAARGSGGHRRHRRHRVAQRVRSRLRGQRAAVPTAAAAVVTAVSFAAAAAEERVAERVQRGGGHALLVLLRRERRERVERLLGHPRAQRHRRRRAAAHARQRREGQAVAAQGGEAAQKARAHLLRPRPVVPHQPVAQLRRQRGQLQVARPVGRQTPRRRTGRSAATQARRQQLQRRGAGHVVAHLRHDGPARGL